MKILLPSLSSGALAMQMFLIMVVTASNSETIKKVIKANAASPKTAELDAAWNGFKVRVFTSYILEFKCLTLCVPCFAGNF